MAVCAVATLVRKEDPPPPACHWAYRLWQSAGWGGASSGTTAAPVMVADWTGRGASRGARASARCPAYRRAMVLRAARDAPRRASRSRDAGPTAVWSLTHGTAAHDSRESAPARPCAGDAQHAEMGAQSRARVGLRRPSEGTRLNPNSCQLPTVSANALRPGAKSTWGWCIHLGGLPRFRLPTPDRRHDEPDVRRSLSVRNNGETARYGSPRPRSLSVG
jgi:hypothetical protein